MEWVELNCILEALGVLVAKYRSDAQNQDLSEDERSDLSNDLAYAEILRDKYASMRDTISSDFANSQV